MNFRKISFPIIIFILNILISCAEPVDSSLPIGPQIPSIDDSASISIVSWNIQEFPQNGIRTLDRVELIMDSLDADFYCLQEIMDKGALQNIVDQLPQYSVVISDETSYMHLAIVYKQDLFLPQLTDDLFKNDYDNFARRPPLLVQFAYEQEGLTQVLNLIDVHMKCCNDGIQKRHDASAMLHEYLNDMRLVGDSNFVVAGDWNDDIYDNDGSGEYSFEAFLDDPENFYFVTDSLAATGTASNASYPSYPSFIDNILISRSLFDEYSGSKVQTLRLDIVFGDYSSTVSDHRPVLWSYTPN